MMTGVYGKGYDCSRLVVALSKHKDTRPLAKKLERLKTLGSIKIDLMNVVQANELLLSRSDGNVQRPIKISAEQSLNDRALSMYAIVCYCRATDTNSDDRGRFDPRRFYNAEQCTWHDGILELRNTAIAHFGTGKHPAGYWASEQLILRLRQSPALEIIEATLQVQSKRAAYRGRVVEELATLVPIALAGLGTDNQKLTESCVKELGKLIADGRNVILECDITEILLEDSFHYVPPAEAD